MRREMLEPGADNDFLEAAWVSFIHWATGEPRVITQFERDTGQKLMAPPRSPIGALIDQATGFQQEQRKILIAFIKWATVNYWVEDDAPSTFYRLIEGENDADARKD